MELKEFIEDTLMQIVGGVKSAQEKAKKQGAYISPSGVRTINNEKYLHINQNVRIPINEIVFEVALTSSDGNEKKAVLVSF